MIKTAAGSAFRLSNGPIGGTNKKHVLLVPVKII